MLTANYPVNEGLEPYPFGVTLGSRQPSLSESDRDTRRIADSIRARSAMKGSAHPSLMSAHQGPIVVEDRCRDSADARNEIAGGGMRAAGAKSFSISGSLAAVSALMSRMPTSTDRTS